MLCDLLTEQTDGIRASTSIDENGKEMSGKNEEEREEGKLRKKRIKRIMKTNNQKEQIHKSIPTIE
jgi:hypothetical protein